MSDDTEQESTTDDERPSGQGTFVFVIPCAILFVVTIFAMIASAFGEAATPLGRFLDRHGTTIIVVEAAVLVGAALVAMSLDRLLTKRSADDEG